MSCNLCPFCHKWMYLAKKWEIYCVKIVTAHFYIMIEWAVVLSYFLGNMLEIGDDFEQYVKCETCAVNVIIYVRYELSERTNKRTNVYIFFSLLFIKRIPLKAVRKKINAILFCECRFNTTWMLQMTCFQSKSIY